MHLVLSKSVLLTIKYSIKGPTLRCIPYIHKTRELCTGKLIVHNLCCFQNAIYLSVFSCLQSCKQRNSIKTRHQQQHHWLALMATTGIKWKIDNRSRTIIISACLPASEQTITGASFSTTFKLPSDRHFVRITPVLYIFIYPVEPRTQSRSCGEWAGIKCPTIENGNFMIRFISWQRGGGMGRFVGL